MQQLVLAVVVVGLAWPAVAEDPKAVIEKAIKAHGGAERLSKIAAVRVKAKGVMKRPAGDLGLGWELVWQAPDKVKISATFDARGQKVSFTQGCDGTTAWGSTNGAVAALPAQRLEELKALANVRRALTLTPLLSDQSYQLAELDAVDIDGKSAAGVKVSAAGHRDISLYFHQDTGLLARIDRPVLESGTQKEITQEEYPSAYEEVDGVKTARKEVWKHSGKTVAELDVSEVAYPKSIDAREFARPPAGISDVPHTRSSDVIYGRKFGMALTMDVFTPKANANGGAIILVVSGGWVSDNKALNGILLTSFVGEPLKRGYTVFAVMHGSQPRFTIPEAVADLNRALRFIRHHAADYRIDPNRIGITGGSAGGHLSLMQGTAGDTGNPKAEDPVDRESSRVQAVACLFPPTDFLNYGDKDKYAFAIDGTLTGFRTAIDVRELDAKTHYLERSNDEAKQKELAAKVSPITHVSADDPPTLIVHGDADRLVPIQQAELIVAKLKEAGVPAELVSRPGRGHDFNGVDKDVTAMMDWFDKHLGKK